MHTPRVTRFETGSSFREVPIARRQGPSDLVRYSHLGVQFALILFLSIFGGIQLDRKLSTGGAFTLLGTFLGAGIGIYVLYRETRRIAEQGSDPDRSAGGDAGGGGGRSDDDPRGVDALSMMGLGAGLGLAIVLGGYYCVQLAFRGPDRYAVKLVVGGFVVRLGLLFAALAVLAAATDIPVSRFVLWLVAFYFVLVLAEAWILAREQMLGPREENPR